MAGFRAPTVGALCHPVILQDRSQAADGGTGLDEAFATVAEAWARIEPIFGGRTIEGQQVEAVATHTITVRHVDGYTAIDHVKMTESGRLFRVRAILNRGERDRWLELLCEELRQAGT
jgi:SPP1 family predicted phage head-tail adaptor